MNGHKDVDAATQESFDVPPRASKEWDYKIGLGVITALAFVTRFFGISHPDEVVFDEVHFGKVGCSLNGMKENMS